MKLLSLAKQQIGYRIVFDRNTPRSLGRTLLGCEIFWLISIVLRADIKPIVDGEAAHRAASPSTSVLTYLRIAI